MRPRLVLVMMQSDGLWKKEGVKLTSFLEKQARYPVTGHFSEWCGLSELCLSVGGTEI